VGYHRGGTRVCRHLASKGGRVSTLRRLREQCHVTPEQLAVAAEVSTSMGYYIEAGKVRPRTAIGQRLARVLGVRPDEIEVGDIIGCT
jgi:DNA-binding XRE family transcriptional regulator